MKRSLFLRMAVAATLTAGGLTLFASQGALAQKPVLIKYHCMVKTVSGWIRIDEGSNSGGEVLSRGGEKVTDRVMRGEELQVSIDDPSFTKKCKCSFLLEAKVTSKNRKVFEGDITIPFKKSFTVPTDVDFDNVLVSVYDPIAKGGKVERRIPIGTRPKKYQ